MTLVELIMALGITIVAVTIASVIVMQGAFVTRQGEETTNNNDASRYAGDVLSQALMSAGLGASNGLYVALSGGMSSHLVSPITALNNPTCTNPPGAVCPDELWVVLPSRYALRNACTDTGGGVMVQTVAGGVLTLRCASGISSSSFPVLMASNMLKGALLSNPTFDTSGTWPKITGYTELGNGYADTPERGGFQVGDLVFPVSIVHYYVANVDNATPGDLVGDAANGHSVTNPAPTALFARQAVVSSSFTAGKPPFTDITSGTTASLQLVQSNIEDLQLAYGFDTKGNGDPGDVQYSPWNSSWNDSYKASLRSVRVNTVSRSARFVLDTSGAVNTSAGYKPMVIEDHAPSATPDGRSRNLYLRRVELPNMAPGNI